MKRLFLLTFIFLCTASLTDAQTVLSAVTAADSHVCDSLRMRAVDLERVYFLSQDPHEAEMALLEKARCLNSLGDAEEAAVALRRIDLSVLDEASRAEVAAMLGEPTAQPESQHKGAKILAFLPPLGHFKAGEYGRGVLCTAVDLGALAFGIWQVASGQWITGWLCGAVILEVSYFDEAMRLVPILTEY